MIVNDKDATLRILMWPKSSMKEHKNALDKIMQLTDNGWEKLGSIGLDNSEFYYIRLVKAGS